MVVEEDLHQLQASEQVYEVEQYNPDENKAVGTWRGSATGLDLVEHREAVHEVRGDLEDLAREGLAIRAKQSSIVRGAVSDIVMEFVADFEDQSTYSGDNIQARVDDALADLDAEDDDQEAEPDDDRSLAESLLEPVAPDPSENGNE
jgi:hypothetical protein